jgi:hypothetical protein
MTFATQHLLAAGNYIGFSKEFLAAQSLEARPSCFRKMHTVPFSSPRDSENIRTCTTKSSIQNLCQIDLDWK